MNGISIIIPVYNTPKEILNRCLVSIDKQTSKNYEVILVDDGSEEECANYMDTLINDKIIVFHTANRGSAMARNYGVNHAKYDHLMFVDSDDVIMPNLLSDAEEAIKKYDSDIVIGLVKRFNPDASISYFDINNCGGGVHMFC